MTVFSDFWGQVGSDVHVFRLILDDFGSILVSFWLHFEARGRPERCLGGVLGPNGDILGQKGAPEGSNVTFLGPNGAPRAPKMRSKWCQKVIKNTGVFGIIFLCRFCHILAPNLSEFRRLFLAFSVKSVERVKTWILARRLSEKLIFEGPRSPKTAQKHSRKLFGTRRVFRSTFGCIF